MKLEVEVDEVRDQQRATIIAAVELRKTGLRWQRRKGVEKRLGFDPVQDDSEGEEEAIDAGRAMRVRQRALLTQVPDLPDRYDPTSVRPPSRRSATPDPDAPPTKRNRIRLPSTSSARAPSHRPSSPHPDTTPAKLLPVHLPSNSEEDLPSESRLHPLRIDSDSESERPTLSVEHSGQPQAAPTTPVWRRRIGSDDEEDTTELAPGRQGLIRKRKVGRRLPEHRRRRTANAFIQFEAEEGDDDESGAESELSPRAKPNHKTLPSSSSSEADSDSESVFDSDSDSDYN